MNTAAAFSIFLFCALSIGTVSAWNQDDLEIFDLVEEINENFYTVLNIDQNATAAAVRKAFRELSVKLHPDKNDAPDANVQFRNLVSVYEVLKDQSKREKYDNVLKNGLPNWKSALYYYRHYRKMGLAEMTAILFGIITVGQYIIAWAAYCEKKYTAESLFGSKLRKLQKKNKSAVNIDELLNKIPTPSIFNTLPFQLVRGVWNAPGAIKGIFCSISEHQKRLKEEKQREAEEAEEQRLLEEEYAKEKEARKEGVRKRKPVFAVKEKTDEELKGYSKLQIGKGSGVKAVTKEPVVSGGLWTDEDITELIRLVKKYPNGTLSRWEIIAEQMNRSVQEVTFMSARMKETNYRQTDSVAEAIVQEATKKVKKIAAPVEQQSKNSTSDALWSQEQQKLLEAAIVKYPKSTAGDRWQKIANTVPGKTKEECLARCKYLVEKAKAQKQKEAAEAQQQDNSDSKKQVDNEIEAIDPNENGDKSTDSAQQTSNVTAAEENDGEEPEPIVEKKAGGKPRNKRKERKKRMEFSSDEDDYDG